MLNGFPRFMKVFCDEMGECGPTSCMMIWNGWLSRGSVPIKQQERKFIKIQPFFYGKTFRQAGTSIWVVGSLGRSHSWIIKIHLPMHQQLYWRLVCIKPSVKLRI
ncbi:hypothetical protein D3C71_1371860 [compost metagenome]